MAEQKRAGQFPLKSHSEDAVRTNPIRDHRDYIEMQDACIYRFEEFHGDIAKREIHWFDKKLNAWITFSDEEKKWIGLDAETGESVQVNYPASFTPWKKTFDDAQAPFFRWFQKGLTNACFNEVDRHVMAGHGEETAFYFESDRWDATKNDGRGGPVSSFRITRKKLLYEVAKCALVLKKLGLKKGDRVCLNMPNILEQIYYTEACKRLGIIYTAIFGGFSAKSLSDRLENAGAKVIITTDGAYRNAQLLKFKEEYTDKALDNYIPLETATQLIAKRLKAMQAEDAVSNRILGKITSKLCLESTVERADVMACVGHALTELSDLSIKQKSKIRTELAKGLVSAPSRVAHVIVVKHSGQAIHWRADRDKWSHELLEEAAEELLQRAQEAGFMVKNQAELLALEGKAFIWAIYKSTMCEPLDAEFPLFFIYTSGSTGKPKGAVHVHGGFTIGVAHSMKVAFDARSGEDTAYVIADPGWIAGQSYLISATLLTRIASVVAEGSPIFPSPGRFASIIDRYQVTIFKAGVTFLKHVMANPLNLEDVLQCDLSSLRVATFFAEPCNPVVQEFGMKVITPRYINSYWATEHGCILWTHFYDNKHFPLKPDARTYPMPWVFGDVWISTGKDKEGREIYRVADNEERGEVVITKPFPSLARTIWGDDEAFLEKFEKEQWLGDLPRYTETYWSRWSDGKNPVLAYTQGDFAMKHAGGSYSFHGRSDDVINVSGRRIGTEEIESTLLKDKNQTLNSPIGNVIVVGGPHREKGLTPIAFVLAVQGKRLMQDDMRRLNELIRKDVGSDSVPSDYIEVSAFPETRSGKYMRRCLKHLMNDEDLGDVTALKNPEVLPEIKSKIADWKRKQAAAASQQIYEAYRYFRIQYASVKSDSFIAIVKFSNPPVNALNERSLDELNTVLDHLARRENVKAVIFTGKGTRSFVAGADVKQLYREMHSLDDALTSLNNAHLAFTKIECMEKPVIAAINGVALGGGNEFALACHYRIAEKKARFGQPEINLRLLPAYGATQRLPRILERYSDRHAAIKKSLEIMLGGRLLSAADAAHIGMIDEVVETDAVTRAVELATNFILEKPGDSKRLKSAVEYRQKVLMQWMAVGSFPDDVAADHEVLRLVHQATLSGRQKAAERIIAAVKDGYEKGLTKGFETEALLFAEAVIAPNEGKAGIKAFLEKKSAPLATRPFLFLSEKEESESLKTGDLLKMDAPFYPSVTKIPKYQYAQAVIRSPITGAPEHGDPEKFEQKVVVPVERPGANEVLLYMLASEVNFNDIWAIVGIPISQFKHVDKDIYITGSGGVGLIVEMGSEVLREGRLKVGDLVSVYPGQSELLSPMIGTDPMYCNFKIQGYETGDGSHQQFMLAQAPQCVLKPQDLSIEAGGSYILTMSTIYRALFCTLQVEEGKSIFIEGAATGTGLAALKIALKNRLHTVGLVSTKERAEFIQAIGAGGTINRMENELSKTFTKVPENPDQWEKWEKAGETLVSEFKEQNQGKLADYVVSHAGELSFPRSFQLLDEGGTLTFFGASSGYHFTFIGKAGLATPDEMLRRIRFRANQSVLTYYGIETEQSCIVDKYGLEIIETLRERGARIVVACNTDAQREFVQSLGFGSAVKHVFSLETLQRTQSAFSWPATMRNLPNPKHNIDDFRDAVREFNDTVFKAFAQEACMPFRTADNAKGNPDVVFERAGQDTLSVSTALARHFTGKVIYAEEMKGRRYSFYAPQVWMRQRKIYMPTANIFGTHMSNAAEVIELNAMIEAGMIEVSEPLVVEFEQLPEAHQEMWENRHRASVYVCNHCLPELGLKSKEELFAAWSVKK
ncbi:AMP-dependent synthetase and ligase [Chloroherpeton thalassium ATCC 35110]|uniref:acetate--CoA ligase n=1 Tax=Chloroherpeton thalassium (strain ATCC 35110 / GB-78) TaxID=517418 RepID=B3QXY6_CHLT3|nr:AMP-binding protein [Chloroherpeton thalassium]ACF13514.1 AMP-dependent synthetase and ligase [Chloroherpeton thalassium ATCC 35110]